MGDITKLQRVLDDLYSFLRDEGFSVHSNAIKGLIVLLHKREFKKLKREIKSPIISGGAGSIIDIDIRDENKSIFLTENIKDMINLIKEF